MRYVFLALLLIASILEYTSQGHVGMGMVSALYFFLMVQADYSANRLLKYGLVMPAPAPFVSAAPEPPRTKIKVEDVLEVNPLGGKKQQPRTERPRAEKPKAAPSRPAPQKPVSVAPLRKPQPKPDPAPLPKVPLFHGKPHEVLAVKENAATQTILKAFRRWVKVYHPDHAQNPADAQRANEQTRCLATAKEKLLRQRKQSPKAA